VILERAFLRSSEFLLARYVRSNRRNDEPLAVGRNVELGVGRDPEKLQDGLVDDDAGAISDGLQTLRHPSFITRWNDGQRAAPTNEADRWSVRPTYRRSAASARGRPEADRQLVSCNALLGGCENNVQVGHRCSNRELHPAWPLLDVHHRSASGKRAAAPVGCTVPRWLPSQTAAPRAPATWM